jgi:hypothetical protein
LDRGSTPRSSTIKQKTTTPKGVFVFIQTVESSLSKGMYKNKKTMRSMVVVFYLQDWNKGINERSKAPREELIKTSPLLSEEFIVSSLVKIYLPLVDK